MLYPSSHTPLPRNALSVLLQTFSALQEGSHLRSYEYFSPRGSLGLLLMKVEKLSLIASFASLINV